MGRLSTLNITRCLYLRPQVWHTHRGWTSEVLAPQSLWSLWTSPLNWRSTAQSGQDKPMHTICHLVFWQLIKHLRKGYFILKYYMAHSHTAQWSTQLKKIILFLASASLTVPSNQEQKPPRTQTNSSANNRGQRCPHMAEMTRAHSN